MLTRTIVTALALASIVPPLAAGGESGATVADEGTNDFWEALGGGKPWLHFRYRFEFADEGGFSPNGYASTLRTALGYETLSFHGFTGMLEFEDVTAIGNDLYNSTRNGRIDRPTIADPEGTEVNQARLRFGGVEGLQIDVGRREISIDDERFVGSVAFRQNHQSYDGIVVDYSGLENATAFYSYVGNVNRVFGDQPAVPAVVALDGNARMDSHLFHGSYAVDELLKATGFAYYLDCDNIARFSTSTVGVRLTGDVDSFGYTAEAAYQKDVTNNPNQVSQRYLHGEARAKLAPLTVLAGYELLGGSGDPGNAFQTPLSTLHKFNGWADKFLTTPDRGLQDAHLKLLGKLGPDKALAWVAAVHGFWADSTGESYGHEFDARLSYKITKELTATLKAATFKSSDAQFTDGTRAWLTMTVIL